MTTLTVHLEDSLLKRTQEIAAARHATVDDVVADALKELPQTSLSQIASEETYEARFQRFEKMLTKFSGFDTGGPFTRDEMNER
jgi:predicted transcriptional regulator